MCVKRILFCFISFVEILICCVASTAYSEEAHSVFEDHYSIKNYHIENEKYFISSDNEKISLDYNYYKVDIDCSSYYLANSFENKEGILKICLFINDNITLKVYSSKDSLIQVAELELSENQLRYFDCYDVYDSEVASQLAYIRNQADMQYMSIIMEYRVQKYAFDNRFSFGDYSDESDGIPYAYTDLFLSNYDPYGRSSYDSNNKRKDDDIVKIIPKTCFTAEGSYDQIGNEYGYFITTYLIEQGHLRSLVFVYDIEFSMPNYDQDEFKIKIIPSISFFYNYYDSTYDSYYGFTTDSSSLVLPESGVEHNYALQNVNFSVILENANAKNVFDEGYNPADDNGDFIVQTRYNYVGSEKTFGGKSLIYDLFEVGMGYVPVAGEVYNGLSSIATIASDIYESVTPQFIEKSQLENGIDTFSMDGEKQIDKYGKLIKAASILNKSSNTHPLLYVGQNNWAQATVLMNAMGGLSKHQDTKLYVGIEFDFVADGTYSFMGITNGSINKMCTYTYNKCLGIYNRKK